MLSSSHRSLQTVPVQVSEDELQSVEARLRTINQGAQYRRANKAQIDVSFVTGLNMHDTHSVVAEVHTQPATSSADGNKLLSV